MENNFEKLENMKKEYNKVEMSKEQLQMLKQSIESAKKDKLRIKRKRAFRNMAAAAAALALFIFLPNTSADVAHAMSNIPILGELVKVVTFRDYHYESESHDADVAVPELAVKEDAQAGMAGDEKIQENLEKTTGEINEEIQQITDSLVEEFKTSLEEEGYQSLVIESEVLNSTPEYFTLKLVCYQAMASGMEWNYIYTIDLATGERLYLKDLFVEGSDYIGVISENIKSQMREQMKADENIHYWLDDEELLPEDIFESITEDVSFYINEQDNIVINFNEGDVAPAYMGVVEFEIPKDAVKYILK